MPLPLIELTGVERRFSTGDTDFVALHDIHLAIHAGEFVAIVGASGCGKSTLLNILGCLSRPDAGRYLVGGRDTRGLPGDELARLRQRHFGFVFQRYQLLTHVGALANVELPAIYAGADRAQRLARALHLLARLGLTGRADHRSNQLSGGQQQRVGIARALMNGAQVILADEPTGALDSESGEDVMRILLELNAEGHTVVIVTHDERLAARARRIIEMRDGRIIRDETFAQTVKPDDAERQYPRSWLDEARAPRPFARLAEACSFAWAALLAHRLRTLLTMLGITIGIASVVSIMAIGEGGRRYVLNEVGSMGRHTIGVYPGHDWGDSLANTIDTLVPADVDALREQPYIDAVTPEVSRPLLLRFRSTGVNASVNGVGESYFHVHGRTLAEGVAFDAHAVHSQAQVAVIDENARRTLFGRSASVLGQTILIDRLPCVVIGVTDGKKGTAGDRNLNVWLPYSTANARLFGQRHVDAITVRVRDMRTAYAAEPGIRKLLERRHGRKDFFTDNADSVVKAVEKTGDTLTLLLSLIAVIALVVGGIGVMNIMLVSVAERTREIGIRMAVGACRRDIMQQFMVEAVMVCVAGGVAGIALSLATGPVFAMFVDQWQMVFSAWSIVLAVLCSTLIGVIFGFVPARNASRLDPVDALSRD